MRHGIAMSSTPSSVFSDGRNASVKEDSAPNSPAERCCNSVVSGPSLMETFGLHQQIMRVANKLRGNPTAPAGTNRDP